MAEAQTKVEGGGADRDRRDWKSKDDSRNDRNRRNGGGHHNGSRGRGGGNRGRGGRGGSRGGNRSNHDSRNDERKPRHNAPSDDPDEIRSQVEFYFSDSNLNKDRFLFEKTGGPENKPIDVETIASFSLMRRFKPFEAVVKALKESEILDINDKNQITRKSPLVTLSSDFEENKRLLAERALPVTLYVKGFRIEPDYRDSQRKVQDFFKPYGIVEVRLRRLGDAKRLFKGSVFVEFPDTESAEKFRTQKHSFEGRDLEVLFKKDYIKREVDNIMEEFDSSDLVEDKDEVIAESRKILELEYMEPQAPVATEQKKADSESETSAKTKIVLDHVAKARSGYIAKQEREREAKREKREAERKAGLGSKSASGANREKRAREDDEGDDPAAKRQRDDENDTKTEVPKSEPVESAATTDPVAAPDSTVGMTEKVTEAPASAVDEETASKPEASEGP